jgi:hypothetical protein
MTLGIQVLAWNRHTKGGGDKPVDVIPILPYERFNWAYQSDIDTKWYMQISNFEMQVVQISNTYLYCI